MSISFFGVGQALMCLLLSWAVLVATRKSTETTCEDTSGGQESATHFILSHSSSTRFCIPLSSISELFSSICCFAERSLRCMSEAGLSENMFETSTL